jgi:hypothetical protein
MLTNMFFIAIAIILVGTVMYFIHQMNTLSENVHVNLPQFPQRECIKKVINTKYDNPDLCDIDPVTPRAENQYAPAEKSYGCDQYLDGAHFEYLPGETRADYHQRWRERARAQLLFHPGDPGYC